MNPSKTIWNKWKNLKSKNALKLEIERSLIPRLRIMAYTLFVIGAISLAYALYNQPILQTNPTPSPYEELDSAGLDLEFLEPEAGEVLNFYGIASIFAFLGVGMLLICWKKERTLQRD